MIKHSVREDHLIVILEGEEAYLLNDTKRFNKISIKVMIPKMKTIKRKSLFGFNKLFGITETHMEAIFPTITFDTTIDNQLSVSPFQVCDQAIDFYRVEDKFYIL